ncbi:hypothetical protein BDV95DRAFT_596925 [Massariosphaeria phaeospora]|uniref:Uncharacterized protein n=1 Tax=Massariosphaeria phaeospora TaxID=100035 RepID=A0A7C8MB00_9PLEO|nr:hypothetical protein BDV95DRAFT_596925 [Massariosphaeria phaeospora]
MQVSVACSWWFPSTGQPLWGRRQEAPPGAGLERAQCEVPSRLRGCRDAYRKALADIESRRVPMAVEGVFSSVHASPAPLQCCHIEASITNPDFICSSAWCDALYGTSCWLGGGEAGIDGV